MKNAYVRIAIARSIILSLFGDNPTAKSVNDFLGWQDYRETEYGWISRGAFRTTIIPTDEDFIIKTGHCADGTLQCLREVQNCVEATSAGLGRYFAQYLGSFKVGNKTFFLFEKIDMVGDVPYAVSSFYEHYTNDQLKNADFLGFSTAFVPPEAVTSLGQFMKRHHINDLHYGNFGWKDDHICYTDFSGASRAELHRARVRLGFDD